MGIEQIELIVGVISLISTFSIFIINTALRIRKRSLQFLFYTNNDWSSTTIAIRNVGTQVIFIDELYLHKSHWIESNIMDKFNKTGSGFLKIAPGKTLRAVFTEEELIEILEQCKEKGNVDYSWPKREEFRLGFKIVASTSEGIGSTYWFKIGFWHGEGKCRQYDFSGYGKTYYELRRYFNSTDCIMIFLIPSILILIGFMTYCIDESFHWLFTLSGYVSLMVISTFYVSDGLPNRNAVKMFSFILTIVFSFLIWSVSGDIDAVIIFSIIIFLFHLITIGKYAGWNM